MKILIISDTHDHVADQQQVITETKGKVDVVIHCGDACAPFMYVHMAAFEVPVHVVWGNCNDKEVLNFDVLRIQPFMAILRN